MSSLSNRIYTYYLMHFDTLPLDKQLHFASRLYLWRHDAAGKDKLRQLRQEILPAGNMLESLQAIGDGMLLPLRPGSINVVHIRQPYFDRYPQLRRTSTMLYWGLLLEVCYGIAARSVLHTLLPSKDLAALYSSLLADQPALAMLSTHAVNFFYLYGCYYQEHGPDIDPAIFGALAANPAIYDYADPLQNQLRIYLLTHAVIGASLFYTQPIPPDKLAAYRHLVVQLEQLLLPVSGAVNLDNKLEFMVCCKLVGYKSQLEPAILREAANSLSPDGDFLIDTHNTNKQAAYTSIDKSEHRSVLYIMATTPASHRIMPTYSDIK